MRRTLLSVIAVLFILMLAPAHARSESSDQLPLFEREAHGYVLHDGTWYLPYRDRYVPVLQMSDLDNPSFRWLIEVFGRHETFTLDLLPEIERWDILGYGCTADRIGTGPYCFFDVNSVAHRMGGRMLEFPVRGEPTRVGPREGFFGLGARQDVRFWRREVFIADPDVRRQLLIRALCRRPHRH